MRKLFLSIILALGSVQIANADILDWADGAWGIDPETVPEDLDAEALEKARGCKKTPVLITIDRENKRYKAVHTGEENFESHGDILAIEKQWISIQYDDEDRLMKNGDPQIWHMFFISRDRFYWIVGPGVRKDEREGIVGTARVRCKSKIS